MDAANSFKPTKNPNMDNPTPQQIAKLPFWAKRHMQNLENRRAEAECALQTALDRQTPSPFFVDEILMTSDSKEHRYIRTFFNPGGNRMTVQHEGVLLNITLPMGTQGRRGIELQWSDPRRQVLDIAMIPQSYQQVVLLPPGLMRTNP